MKTIILALFLFSCSPAKWVARQDSNNTELKAKWAVDWAKANPCVIDTTIITGVHDTLTKETVRFDTLYIPPFGSDTVYTERVTKTVLKNNTITITKSFYVTDLRQINALTVRIAASQNDIVKQTALTNVANAKANKYQWLFWLVLIGVIVIGGIAGYFILTPKHFS